MMLVKRIRLVGHLIHCYSPRWVMVAWKEFGLVWRKFDTQFRPGEYKENSKTFLIPTPINKIRIRNAGGTFSPPAKVIVEGILKSLAYIM